MLRSWIAPLLFLPADLRLGRTYEGGNDVDEAKATACRSLKVNSKLDNRNGQPHTNATCITDEHHTIAYSRHRQIEAGGTVRSA